MSNLAGEYAKKSNRCEASQFIGTASLVASATPISNSPLLLDGLDCGNPNGAITYIQVFDKTSANVTLGSTTPDMVLFVNANNTRAITFPTPLRFANGLTIAATTTAGGSTGPGTAVNANAFYRLQPM